MQALPEKKAPDLGLQRKEKAAKENVSGREKTGNGKVDGMSEMEKNYEEMGAALGRLCSEKNKAYGNSFGDKSAEFLKLLYPNGINPDQYKNMLALARIFDKQMRIATDKDAFGENPFADIAGYGILMCGETK